MAARPIVKPYFPMVLSNGADVVLVDYSGSMHCDSGHLHLEQHQDAHGGWHWGSAQGTISPGPERRIT